MMCAAGEVIPDGQEFRNIAHLRYKADLLVRRPPTCLADDLHTYA
jgi:hypothetical protein